VTRSAAARAEVADFDRARKGASALIARVCSMMGGCDVFMDSEWRKLNWRVFGGERGSAMVVSECLFGCLFRSGRCSSSLSLRPNSDIRLPLSPPLIAIINSHSTDLLSANDYTHL
jgi:hypothetical protein